MKKWLIAFGAMLLSGCLGMPETVKPVTNFEKERYLGTWYEIARLDHSFERGLSQVTAEYSQRPDGGIAVINRGYLEKKQQWQEATAKAFFVNDEREGYLKVSFFGPFYGSYVIFHLDEQDYQYAFVSGANTDYLWLLARTPTVAPDVMQQFLAMAKARGFATDKLIYPEHKLPEHK